MEDLSAAFRPEFAAKGYTIYHSGGVTEICIPTTDGQGRPAVKTLRFAGLPIFESGPEPWQTHKEARNG